MIFKNSLSRFEIQEDEPFNDFSCSSNRILGAQSYFTEINPKKYLAATFRRNEKPKVYFSFSFSLSQA